MFATGMGCGFLMPSTTQGVILWFPTKERATVMGLKQTAVNIGGIITALTLPAVALALGWRYGFLFLGIIAIVVSLVVQSYRDRFTMVHLDGVARPISVQVRTLVRNEASIDDVWSRLEEQAENNNVKTTTYYAKIKSIVFFDAQQSDIPHT